MSTTRLDTRKLDSMIAELGDSADDWLNGIANQMVGDIKTSFGSGPGGKTYVRGNVAHVASSPGFPPNVDIGALTGSIQAIKIGHLHHRIQDGVEYGLPLEDGIGMAPRPFVGPVFEDWRRKILLAAMRGLIP